MKITLLNSLISLLVAGWCVFGVLIHGWQILFYPLAWAAIVGSFFVLNLLHQRKKKEAAAPQQKVESIQDKSGHSETALPAERSSAVSAQ